MTAAFSCINMSECYLKKLKDKCSSYECNVSPEVPVTICGSDRIIKIAQSSSERGDSLHGYLEQLTSECDNPSIQCHRSCVSTYTSAYHIRRHLKRTNETQPITSYQPSPVKRICRSHIRPFNFYEHCLFCGEVCEVAINPKHPDRWRPAYKCRNSDRGLHFKEVVIETCKTRNDNCAREVLVRLQGAVADLHAAEGRYHNDCRITFMAPNAVSSAGEQKCSKKEDAAFSAVIHWMAENRTLVWTSVSLYESYTENGGTRLSRGQLQQELLDYFKGDLIILSAKGLANIFLFREKASGLVKLVEDEEEDISVRKVVKRISKESKELASDKQSYKVRLNRDSIAEDVSATLMDLLSQISDKLSWTLPAILIGNMITGAITNNPTPLQIALGVLVREKHLLKSLFDFGVTCSYDEVLRFKASAAAHAESQRETMGMLDSDQGLIQAVGDNFDASISSQNGMKSTHALAMLLTQVQSDISSTDQHKETIKRLEKVVLHAPVATSAPIQYYKGPKKPAMPQEEPRRSVLPLKVLARQSISVRRGKELDLHFLKRIAQNSLTPEFAGFNTMQSRQEGQSVKPANKTVYRPLIDMVPSDPTTMMTAMVEAQTITRQAGQTFTVFTADQQLYRVMVNVIWVYPEMFKEFVPRLGGMHMLMSFVGCIGTLMANSGLEDVMKSAFGGVPHMLSGKKFPQNCRALRLVTEELLRENILGADDQGDLMQMLEETATQSRTSRLWVDCLIKPVLIIMLFVRAEREGDWPLHLWAVRAMLPYFFAAGHWNYARYGLYYLRSMERLPTEVLDKFLKGEHVMRHKPGLWNGLWSDMFIETTFMRYGHGPGGLIGITLNVGAQTRWALSLHTCSQLIKDIADIRDDNSASQHVTFHKEETKARIKSDAKDRNLIQRKLQSSIDPLNTEGHPSSGIVNIVSGMIGGQNVNVDKAVNIGKAQMKDFEAAWPESFNAPLTSKVVTMAISKKKLKQGSGVSFDTELIYGRVMGLMSTRVLDLENLFQHELAPIPTSMFSDNGEMRLVTTKAVLKRKLQCEQSARNLCQRPSVVIIDGCAVLWTIHWPTQGTVQVYVEGFLGYVTGKLRESDVYLIFDRYNPYSIKSGTRSTRAMERATRQHQLRAETSLPAQNVVLTVTENKTQMIAIICQQLLDRVASLQTAGSIRHKLLLTGPEPVPAEVDNGAMSQRNDMRTTHEEADIIVVQQMVKAADHGHKSIKVISDDTDVFILLLHYYDKCRITAAVVMEGTSSQRSTTDIAATAAKHKDIVPQLLAAHALSGCDTVAYMFGIGKLTVLKVLQKGLRLLHLGDPTADLEDILQESSRFVAACYGCKSSDNLSKARYETWLIKTSKRSVVSTPKLKCLPPTALAFNENVKRAHVQACIWKAALDPDPPRMNPTDFGWSKDASSQTLVPVRLPPGIEAAPAEVLQLLKCGCSTEEPCGTARCGCATAQMTCTVFCKCFMSQNCQNRWTKWAAWSDDADGAGQDEDESETSAEM